jgi:hypothetical protein
MRIVHTHIFFCYQGRRQVTQCVQHMDLLASYQSDLKVVIVWALWSI